MAADRQRLAAALAYEEERRRRMMESVPVIDGSTPTTEPRRSLRSDLENLSSGLGQAGVNILEGGKALLTDPIGTVKGTYETVKGVVRDPSLIADALRYTADKAMSGPLGAGEVIGEMVNPVRFRKTPVMQEIDVYHGSPHRFEEFDASKIGTGEGAQAYGHGIYFAESPDVAKSYQTALASERGFRFGDKTNLTRQEIQDLVNAQYPGYLDDVARPSLVADYVMDDMVTGLIRPEGKVPKQFKPGSEREKLFKQLQKEISHADKGALYTADLPDEMVDRMLDWDKPLSEQPKVLRALLNSDDEWKAYTAQLSPKSRKLAEDMAVGAKPNTGDEAFKLFKQLDADNPNADHNAIYDVIRKYNPRTTDQDWIMSMMSGSAAPGAGIRGGGGADLYNTLGGGEQAAQRLRAAGIPGMQYLDAGSRGQGGGGTRNFVVFPGEEKKVKILSRE